MTERNGTGAPPYGTATVLGLVLFWLGLAAAVIGVLLVIWGLEGEANAVMVGLGVMGGGVQLLILAEILLMLRDIARNTWQTAYGRAAGREGREA